MQTEARSGFSGARTGIKKQDGNHSQPKDEERQRYPGDIVRDWC